MTEKDAGSNCRVNMRVNLGGLEMHNPITVASGTFGSGREYAELWKKTACSEGILLNEPEPEAGRERISETQSLAHGVLSHKRATPLSALGALTTKGVSLVPWEGNDTPRIAETASGMLNSIGLQNKGVEAFCADDLVWLKENASDVPVIVNVCGHGIGEYASVIERLEREKAVSAYEINISCPNVGSGGMSFGTDPKIAAEVTARCRKVTTRPLIVKLTPNVTDITVIARAVEDEGADALSLINTVTGMAIDAQTKRPLLARVQGGLSGPAIKPIALYAVYRCYQAVSIPLLGMGGIAQATDAIEFFLAGATAVAVGTTHFSNPLCTFRLAHEIEMWCESQGVKDINELTGGLLL